MNTNNISYLKFQKEYKKVHYASLRPGILDYVHKRTLEMLKIIIPILHENNIRYFLCGGSLRGAYLQGGILPWDEDIDLCIVEEDYEQMVKLLLGKLPSGMVIQCAQTEPKYYHGWAKIRDLESHIFPDESLYKYNGVLIDLYKMKFTNENSIEYEIAKEHYEYLNRRLNVGGISKSEFQKRVLDNCLIDRINSQKQTNSLICDVKKYIIMENHRVIMDPNECFPRRLITFEGMDLYSFFSVDSYLLRHYGKDYASFPNDKSMFTEMNDVIYNGG